MKRLSVLLPLGLLISGCTAPAAENTAPVAGANTTPAAATAPTAVTETYRVVDEAQPGSPKDMVDALHKVALPPPPADFKVPANPRVKLHTTAGDVTLSLDPKAAPLHVKSFLYLVSKGFYDGTFFHRWADLIGGGKGYIIQGGDPLTKDQKTLKYAGGGGPGYQIPREYNGLKHDKLVIAAARTSDPNSAGSQFYITQNPVYFLDEGDGYTVFGKVTGGKESEETALKLRRGTQILKATILK